MRKGIALALLAAGPAWAQADEWREPLPEMKAEIEKAVRAELKDEESARFRWLQEKVNAGIYCGFVNATNSFGAYEGYQPFLIIGSFNTSGDYKADMAVVGLTARGSLVQIGAMEMCLEEGYNITIVPRE